MKLAKEYFPEIEKFYSKNNNIDFNELNIYSEEYMDFICLEHGHEFSKRAVDFINKNQRNCPYCANRKLLKGFNDLETYCNANKKYSYILKQYSKNNTLKPNEIIYNSGIILKWTMIDCGHEWEMALSNKLKNTQCQFCNGRQILNGFNDFESNYPNLLERWDYEKNTIKPNEITKKSSIKVWWKCANDLDHSFLNTVKGFVTSEPKCPYCSGKKVLKGFNDLEKLKPEIAKYLNEELNNFKASEVTIGSAKELWWNCIKCNDIYKVSVKSRTNTKAPKETCNKCSKQYSYLENKVFNYLNEILPEEIIIKNSRPLIKEDGSKLELDLLLPEYNIAFEVQDIVSHSKNSDFEKVEYRFESMRNKLKKGPIYHNEKTQLAQEQLGIKVIELWEEDIRDNSFIDIISKNLKINKNLINANSKLTNIMKNRLKIEEYRHESNNTSINVMKNHDVYLWRCKINPNHVFESDVKSLLHNKKPCKICSKNVLNNENSIANSIHNKDYSERNYLSAHEVIAKLTNDKYYWTHEEHVFKMSLVNKLTNHNCNICFGAIFDENVNSFSAKFPLLAEYFSPLNKIGAHEIRYGNRNLFYWRRDKCLKDYKYSLSYIKNNPNFCNCLK